MSQLLADMKEMLTEQVTYRDLLWQMTKRDLLLRYKQTVMGFGWAVFMPVMNTLIFSVIFMRVAPIQTDLPYPLYAFCGLWAWNYFALSLKFSVNSLVSNANLVGKIYFPREVFPFSAVLVSLVDSLVAFVLLLAMMAYYGIWPTWTILFLPLLLVIQTAFTSAVALIVALGNLFYRDVKYIFEFVLTFWMFATSVVYPVERAGGTLGAWLALNPLTPMVDGYRDVLLRGRAPDLMSLAVLGVASLGLLLFAWTAFHRAEFSFAENL